MGVFGVFDGHGGQQASTFCEQNFLRYLKMTIDPKDFLTHNHLARSKLRNNLFPQNRNRDDP